MDVESDSQVNNSTGSWRIQKARSYTALMGRTGQTITADTAGVIIGEYWGGSTNTNGEAGAWRGWTIVSAP